MSWKFGRSLDLRLVAAGSLPPDPFKAGSTQAGGTLYVARAWHKGSLIPGKLIETHDTVMCRVCFGWGEYEKDDFEVGTLKKTKEKSFLFLSPYWSKSNQSEVLYCLIGPNLSSNCTKSTQSEYFCLLYTSDAADE